MGIARVSPTKPFPDSPPRPCSCGEPRVWKWRKSDKRWIGVCATCKARRKRELLAERNKRSKLPHHAGHSFDDALECKCGQNWSDHQRDLTVCPLSQQHADEKARQAMDWRAGT